VEAAAGDEVLLRRVEVPGTDEDDVVGAHRRRVDQLPQRHPPRIPRRRALGGVEVAVRVDPDDADPAVARGEPFHDAHMRAAATAEQERARGQVGREGEGLLVQRVLRHDDRFGKGQLEVRRLGHRLAAVSPRSRDPQEACRELAPADVALILRAERDGRERLALGALRTQPAHTRSFR
jgi:hypothetical protein